MENDNQKRMLLAVALSIGLMYAVQALWMQPAQEEALRAEQQALGAVADAGAAPAQAQAGPALAASPPGSADAGADAPPPIEAQLVRISTPGVEYILDNRGGVMTQATLQGSKERVQRNLSPAEGYRHLMGKPYAPSPQVETVRVGPSLARRPWELTLGEPASPVLFSVDRLGPLEVRLTGQDGKVQIQKTFLFSEQGNTFRMKAMLSNMGDSRVEAPLSLHLSRAVAEGEEEAPSFFGSIGNQASLLCLGGKGLERVRPHADAKPETFEQAQMVAIDQQYFLMAAYSLQEQPDAKCELYGSPSERKARWTMPASLEPGKTLTLEFLGFAGSKEEEVLDAAGQAAMGNWVPKVTEALHQTIDYGWWAVLAKILVGLLKFFQRWVGNWGLAIVALTVFVKLLTFPLQHKAMASAEAMKKLQPQLEEIKKKYAGDTPKQNQEQMALYQKNGVNPLGGCLPLLIQIPIWGALFTALRTSYDLYGAPFVGPWTDLTVKDPTYLFPLALGVTMIITQRLQPQMMDPVQAKMMTYVMPVFFTMIMLNYPAGLSLYIFTSNLLSIVQQYGLRRYLEHKGVAAPRVPLKSQSRNP